MTIGWTPTFHKYSDYDAAVASAPGRAGGNRLELKVDEGDCVLTERRLAHHEREAQTGRLQDGVSRDKGGLELLFKPRRRPVSDEHAD